MTVSLLGLAVYAQAPTTVTYLAHFSTESQEYEVYKRLFEEFMRRNPDITIQYLTALPGQDNQQRIRVMAAAGNAPDVIFTESWYLPALVEEGLLLSLEPYVRKSRLDLKDFFPVTVELARYRTGGNVSLYALPRHPSPMAVFVNMNALSEMGLPKPPVIDDANTWNWTQYLNYAKLLTIDRNGDNKIDQYGSNFPSAIPHTAFPIVRSFGGTLIDAIERRAVFNEGTVAGFQFIADLRNVHRVTPLPGESIPSNPFARGFFAMSVGIYPEMVGFAQLIGNSFNWDIVPIPAGPAGRINRSVAGLYAIMRGSKNPEAAWRLVEFLVSDYAQRQIAASGVVMPSRISTARDVLITNVPPLLRGRNARVFADGLLGTTEPEPQLVEFQEVTRIFTEELQSVWNGQEAARRALERIAARVNAVLASRAKR